MAFFTFINYNFVMDYQKTLEELWKECESNNIVRLSNIEKEYSLEGELYAKVENKNLTGSIKDLTALQMVEDAIKEGKIKEDTIFIEATSGNTGISISYIAKKLGLKAIIVMPSSMSLNRRKMIVSYGGELLLIDGGMKQCEDKVKELLENDSRYICLSQFTNKSNPKVHFLKTGPRIHKTLPELDYIVAGIGTGGTISGIGMYYKTNNINTSIIGLEPQESPLITKGSAGKHLIQGIGANFVPETYLSQYVDEVRTVKGEEAVKIKETIKNLEGIDVGISSGASLLGVIEILKENKGKKAIAIFPDNGNRYNEI